MIEIASLIVLNLVIAAFIGFLIGFIIGKSLNKTENLPLENKTDDTISSTNSVIELSDEKENKPFILSSPRQNGKDNLRKIKGIDSVIEKELNALGIFHFDQISNWSKRNCEWIEEFLKLSGVVTQLQWVEQAKILETGKETMFSLKVEKDEEQI